MGGGYGRVGRAGRGVRPADSRARAQRCACCPAGGRPPALLRGASHAVGGGRPADLTRYGGVGSSGITVRPFGGPGGGAPCLLCRCFAAGGLPGSTSFGPQPSGGPELQGAGPPVLGAGARDGGPQERRDYPHVFHGRLPGHRFCGALRRVEGVFTSAGRGLVERASRARSRGAGMLPGACAHPHALRRPPGAPGMARVTADGLRARGEADAGRPGKTARCGARSGNRVSSWITRRLLPQRAATALASRGTRALYRKDRSGLPTGAI